MASPVAGWSRKTFEFAIPRRIEFGWGCRVELPVLLGKNMQRLFLVTGAHTVTRNPQVQEILDQLAASGREVIPVARVEREPEVEDVDQGALAVAAHRPGPADAVLAIGGGSAIDVGKALAGLATNGEGVSVLEFLEGVGSGRQITREPLFLAAMPTTAGTGSEATKNAVISSRARGFKKSLRSPLLLPPLALIDPELTASCPQPVTVASGMDAITQLLESCISVRATPMSQALSWQGLRGTLAALREAAHHPQSRAPREQMALAALLSGMALANSGLGLAHGVAASLGIHCGVAHGLACAVMLPVAIQVNREVAAVPLAEAAATLLERNFDTPERAIDELQAELSTLYEELGLPRRLGELGVPRDQISAIARDSFGNSMSGNPQSLTPPELSELLHANW